MKLYYSKGACSLAVRIAINELNIPCEFESVNLKNKQTEHHQDFFKINVKGSVPCLQLDDGSVLTENAVIQQYLADHHHGAAVLPKADNMKRYRVLEWLNYISTELHKGCSPFFNADLPTDIKDKFFKPALIKKLDYVEQNLAKHPFIVGDNFTLADGYLFVILSWLPPLGFEHKEWPHIEKYFNTMRQRPAIQKSLADEKLL